MRKTLFLLAAICMMAVSAASAQTERMELRKQSLSVFRATPQSESVTMRDSIVGRDGDEVIYRCIYTYDSTYGYLTSLKTYDIGENGKLTLNISDSYAVDYEFDSNGRCIRRSEYAYNADGSTGTETYRAEAQYKGDSYYEYRYDCDYDGSLYCRRELGYDRWDNLTHYVSYRRESRADDNGNYRYVTYPEEILEQRFSGKVYNKRVEYNSSTDYDSEAVQKYRYYYVNYSYNYAKGFKCDTVTTVTTRTVSQYEGYTYSLNPSDFNYDVQAIVTYIESLMKLSEERILTWNTEQTRLLSKIRNFYYSNSQGTSSTNTSELNTTYGTRFEYDGLSRLTKLTDFKSNYGGTELDEHTETYTYADDFARAVTLEQMIETFGDGEGCRGLVNGDLFGKVKTYRYENSSQDAVETFTADQWNELGYFTHGYGEETSSKEGHDSWELWRYFNAAGLLDYTIENVASNGQHGYLKIEYIYDEQGKIIGYREYEGETVNGPWTLVYENYRWKAPRRASKHQEYDEEGWHVYIDAEYDDEGNIISGRKRRVWLNTVYEPVNPDWYFSLPEAPFGNDEVAHSVSPTCMEIYEFINGQWQLVDAHGIRCYRDANGNIISEYYKMDWDYEANARKLVKDITRYTLDTEGRLVKSELLTDNYLPTGFGTTYTYLESGSQLLATRTEVDGKGQRDYVYYYSKHAYINPETLAVESIKSSEKGNANPWYDLNGRRLAGKPTSKGVYVNNGRKVLVKK